MSRNDNNALAEEQKEENCTLFHDAKRFILLSLENGSTHRSDTTLWDFLSDKLKEDRDIVLAAFVCGHVKLEDLPDPWNRDRAFFLEAAGKRSMCWYEMPEEYQRDPEIVRNFPRFRNNDLVADVFAKIPALRHDHDIWDTIIGSKLYSLIEVLDTAPISVLSDPELMIKACCRDYKVLRHVGGSLALNRDFLQRVVDAEPNALWCLCHDAQRRFPELLVDNLQKCLARDICQQSFLRKVAVDVRELPSFVKAWFTSGGLYYEDYFPASTTDDEQIFLWIAECGRWPWHVAFEHMSERLKGDKDFILKAIEYMPDAYWCASDEVKSDDYVQLEALASTCSFAHDWAKVLYRNEQGTDHFENMTSAIARESDLYETFMTTILLGISLPADKSHCPLTLLNQGVETSLAYKKLIMEYVGVPTGADLQLFRRALKNLRDAEESLNNRDIEDNDSDDDYIGPVYAQDGGVLGDYDGDY